MNAGAARWKSDRLRVARATALPKSLFL